MELAEQIPYSHPSQLKLARLLQQMARSPKVTTKVKAMPHGQVMPHGLGRKLTNSILQLGNVAYVPFRRLGETFRDNLQCKPHLYPLALNEPNSISTLKGSFQYQ